MEPHPNLPRGIKPSPAWLRHFFFISGIIATLAYRIIFLLDAVWIDIAWYTGTMGFILYFWHRTQVESKRANLIKTHGLIPVLEKSDIPEEQKSALLYLIETSLTSKARFNSAFILITSVLALVISIAMDAYTFFT